jgi:hypothetical protein
MLWHPWRADVASRSSNRSDEGEPRRVEHLGHRCTHLLVHRKLAGVDEGGPLVVDHGLVEADALLRREDANPIDSVSYLVDPRYGALSFRLSGDARAAADDTSTSADVSYALNGYDGPLPIPSFIVDINYPAAKRLKQPSVTTPPRRHAPAHPRQQH